MEKDEASSASSSSSNNLQEHLVDFSGYTTLHGLHFVFGKSGLARRVLWMVLILIGFGFCTHQLIISFEKLQDNREEISKDILPSEQLPFPAVTICNINMMKKHKLRKNRDAKLFLDKLNIMKYSADLFKQKLNDSFNIEDALHKDGVGYSAKDLLVSCTWDGEPCSHLNFTLSYSYLVSNV